MKLSYRTQRNAEAVAAYWKKPLDKIDWYEVKAQSEDEAEIYIYDPIGWPWLPAGELVRTLSEMKQKTITVRINSPGGDAFDAFAIFNALQSHSSKIITRTESLAASAASFIAAAGKERQAYKNAMFMYHEPWVFAIGNQHDLRETADLLGKIAEAMVEMYADTSNVGKRELRDMLKAETWMTAKEAKEKGFIDTILDGKGAKAEFDLSVYAHVPDALAPEGRRSPTERDAERILRDAGFTRSEAKRLLAGRQQEPEPEPEPAGGRQEPAADAQQQAEVAALIRSTTAIIGG